MAVIDEKTPSVIQTTPSEEDQLWEAMDAYYSSELRDDARARATKAEKKRLKDHRFYKLFPSENDKLWDMMDAYYSCKDHAWSSKEVVARWGGRVSEESGEKKEDPLLAGAGNCKATMATQKAEKKGRNEHRLYKRFSSEEEEEEDHQVRDAVDAFHLREKEVVARWGGRVSEEGGEKKEDALLAGAAEERYSTKDADNRRENEKVSARSDGIASKEEGERHPFAVVVGTYVIADGGKTKDGANVETRGDAAKDEQRRRLNRMTTFFENVYSDAMGDFETALETVGEKLSSSFQDEWAKAEKNKRAEARPEMHQMMRWRHRTLDACT